MHFVTLLEEMPVQETADGVAELRAAGLPVGGVVINMVRPQVLDEAAVEAAANGRRAEVARALAHALERTGSGGRAPKGRTGLISPPAGPADAVSADPFVEPLLQQAREHTERLALEHRGRGEIARLALPTYELQLLGDGVDLAGLYRMARELRKQGVAR
ncbi:hypothetical protein GCM10020000_37730 [Streptomyces olivoverticillatus]